MQGNFPVVMKELTFQLCFLPLPGHLHLKAGLFYPAKELQHLERLRLRSQDQEGYWSHYSFDERPLDMRHRELLQLPVEHCNVLHNEEVNFHGCFSVPLLCQHKHVDERQTKFSF